MPCPPCDLNAYDMADVPDQLGAVFAYGVAVGIATASSWLTDPYILCDQAGVVHKVTEMMCGRHRSAHVLAMIRATQIAHSTRNEAP